MNAIEATSSTADEDVAAAEENWAAATSNGLPPPLCSELPVAWLLALVAVQLAGILGASKICDDVPDDVPLVVDFPVSADSVLEVELVGPGEELVSTTRLVGTSVELAVEVLLTMAVVEGCVFSAVDEYDVGVVGAADELGCDCKTSFALPHKFCGPRPCRKRAKMFESVLLLSEKPSLEHASFTSLAIEASPLTHGTLQLFCLKSFASQPVMACW